MINVATVSRMALTTKIQIMGVPTILLSCWSMAKKFIPKKDYIVSSLAAVYVREGVTLQ